MASSIGTVSFVGTSQMSLGGVSPANPLSVKFVSPESSRFAINYPTAVNPITGAKDYRVIMVDIYGKQYGEVENASLDQIRWSITDQGSFSFSVPIDDSKVSEIQVPEREVQVWRGGRLLWWGVITKARSDAKTVQFQCQTVEWYFDRRLMGPIPRIGHFKGVHLEYGTGAWNMNYMPGSKPARKPVASISDQVSVAGGNSMALSASGGRTTLTRQGDDLFTTRYGSQLSGPGQSSISNAVDQTFGESPTITVNVYTDNTQDYPTSNQQTQDRADAIAAHVQSRKPKAKVIATGLGRKAFVATNTSEEGRAKNRYATLSFRNDDAPQGHQQYASQSYSVMVPREEKGRLKATFRAWVYVDQFEAPAANNWGVMCELQDPTVANKNPALAAAGFKKVVSRAVVPISKQTPLHRWIRMEASVAIPNDGKTYVVEGRLFPPSGLAYFDEADLFTDDALNYVNDEQAQILRDLIDHAQDPAMGKTSMNISKRIRDTGIMRTRRYAFGDRSVVGDNLNEFTTLGDGMEWDIQVTPTTRTFVSYFPRKQRYTGYYMVLGQNIADYSADVDATSTSNQVVIMANDVEEYAREERSATDLSLIDGPDLEIAYLATPGSSLSSLSQQAKRGLERYRKPVTIPSISSNPAYCEELLNGVQTGDIVDVDVRVGWFQTVAKHRVLDMTLDPKTEVFTYTLMPEDTPIKVISGFGGRWKYKAGPQSASTGPNNVVSTPTHPEYASPTYDDSSWAIGTGGIGWYVDGTAYSEQQDVDPATTIPVNNEVWLRKQVMCTEEMYVSLRVDQFAYLYVNGNLIRNRHYIGKNFANAFLSPAIRIPQEYLDPSGVQVVMVHVQDRMRDQADGVPRALYADAKVRGIYDTDHVGARL